VRAVIVQLGIDERELLKKYENELFEDSHPKAPVFTELLSGNPTNATISYLVRRLTEGFGHLRGDRSGAEYGADLVLGWLVEDAFHKWAFEADIAPALSGYDRNREFLRPGRISAASDFVVGASRRKLELATDYKGHWQRTGKYDLRDSKFSKLVSENAILFLIDVMNSRGAVLDLSTPDRYAVKQIPFHPVYRKPAMQISGVRELLVPISEATSGLVDLVG
jgi:hypothetical protein